MNRVSIIIPAYNSEKTLKNCLSSILNQTYKNFEVIVVDNNSSDSTKVIINEFKLKNKNVKYIFEKRRGRGASRNAGIKEAKGDLILMIDSDCIAPRNWIEEMITPLLKGEKVVMGFEKDLVNNYWTRNIQKANFRFYQSNFDGKYISLLDTKNFAIKAGLMKKLMFDSELENCEDLDFYIRVSKFSKIIFKPQIKVWHNHKSSFIDIVKINFERGYWTARIYKKYKKDKKIYEISAFESISVKSYLLFPFFVTSQFRKKPIGESYFTLIYECSWRIGIIWGLLKV